MYRTRCSYFLLLKEVKKFHRVGGDVPEEGLRPEHSGKGKEEACLWKAKHYHKACRQMYGTEIPMARAARKAGNLYVPAEPKLAICRQNPRYQWSKTKCLYGIAASSSSTDLQQIINVTFVKVNTAGPGGW